MSDLFIKIEGIPYCQQRGQADENLATQWTNQIIAQTKNIPSIHSPCSLNVLFKLPQDKFPTNFPFGPDLDNLTKRLFDSLNSTLFSEIVGQDSCVISLQASKEKCPSGEDSGAIINIDLMPQVITYTGLVEFTVDGDEHFVDKIRLRDIKRRIVHDSFEISMTFKAQYFREVFSYSVSLQCINKTWVGQYLIDGDGRTEGPISSLSVSEKDSNLEILGSWGEGNWDYRMKVTAKAENIDFYSKDEFAGK